MDFTTRMLQEALQRLTGIDEKVDNLARGQEIIRELVMQHDRWIAGHEQGSSFSAESRLKLEMQVNELDTRWEKGIVALVAVTILTLLNSLVQIVQMFRR